MKSLLFCLIIITSFSCQSQENGKKITPTIQKSETEWKKQLSSSEFEIIRKKGTERAFTGEYWNTHIDGIYHCKACNFPLFKSGTKFQSGTGWPSFSDKIEQNVSETVDKSNGWTRTEITCARCDGHLGHVFNDGPEPTGLRYCVNSASLTLVADE